MSTSETGYRFRSNVPVMIERAREQETVLQAYAPDGTAAVPDSATYSLLRPDGTKAVDAATASPRAAGGAAYAIPAASIPADATTPLGTRWQERWTLTFGTVVKTLRRPAALALFELHPMVADVDLTELYPDLLDSLGDYRSNLQTWLDQAWARVMRQLWRNGDFPYIIVEPTDLYDWVQHEGLSNVFAALVKMSASTGSSDDWQRLWDYHRNMAEAAAGGVRITVDRDQDGLADNAGKDSAAAAKSVVSNHPYTHRPRHIPSKFR